MNTFFDDNRYKKYYQAQVREHYLPKRPVHNPKAMDGQTVILRIVNFFIKENNGNPAYKDVVICGKDTNNLFFDVVFPKLALGHVSYLRSHPTTENIMWCRFKFKSADEKIFEGLHRHYRLTPCYIGIGSDYRELTLRTMDFSIEP